MQPEFGKEMEKKQLTSSIFKGDKVFEKDVNK